MKSIGTDDARHATIEGHRELDSYDAYRSAELAQLYDAVYADWGDIAFWEAVVPSVDDGPVLDLGCGTGRVLRALAQSGHRVTGVDLAPHMLERCREKLGYEPAAVRGRVMLVEGDMASFEVHEQFAQILCASGAFHHLSTMEKQLACLERCRNHLLPQGTLVLDLFCLDPTSPSAVGESPADNDPAVRIVEWTDGRRIRSWATVLAHHRSLQRSDCEVIYEVIEADGSVRRVIERFPMRTVSRNELEHLLARSGFRVISIYGDYDRSTFGDESLGMIVIAQPIGE